MDLSKQLIPDSLDYIILHHGEANAYNENAFTRDVSRLLLRIDLYDQIWRERHALDSETHSPEAIELIQEFIKRLESIPDGCAEIFPFEMIEELRLLIAE